MKEVYEDIEFVGSWSVEPRSAWACVHRENGYTLGRVEWHPAMKEYVFAQDMKSAVFPAGRLRDIAAFLDEATAAEGGGNG